MPRTITNRAWQLGKRLRFLRPDELKKPDLACHATVEPERAHPRAKTPRLGVIGRPPLRLQPKLVMRAAGFQNSFERRCVA